MTMTLRNIFQHKDTKAQRHEERHVKHKDTKDYPKHAMFAAEIASYDKKSTINVAEKVQYTVP